MGSRFDQGIQALANRHNFFVQQKVRLITGLGRDVRLRGLAVLLSPNQFGSIELAGDDITINDDEPIPLVESLVNEVDAGSVLLSLVSRIVTGKQIGRAHV